MLTEQRERFLSRITRLAKTAARAHKEHAHTEIVSIIRHSPKRWEAHVEYTYGRARWPEKVTFIVTPRTRRTVVVVVFDSDYPQDRETRCVIDKHTVDMPSFITTFLVSGRW